MPIKVYPHRPGSPYDRLDVEMGSKVIHDGDFSKMPTQERYFIDDQEFKYSRARNVTIGPNQKIYRTMDSFQQETQVALNRKMIELHKFLPTGNLHLPPMPFRLFKKETNINNVPDIFKLAFTNALEEANHQEDNVKKIYTFVNHIVKSGHGIWPPNGSIIMGLGLYHDNLTHDYEKDIKAAFNKWGWT